FPRADAEFSQRGGNGGRLFGRSGITHRISHQVLWVAFPSLTGMSPYGGYGMGQSGWLSGGCQPGRENGIPPPHMHVQCPALALVKAHLLCGQFWADCLRRKAQGLISPWISEASWVSKSNVKRPNQDPQYLCD